ncbi:MAG: hypothetical protein IJ482_02110 [Alphaproteobacteria bacterium]|nr:hypothetical protein [Alphaproteobacteria bacterium]
MQKQFIDNLILTLGNIKNLRRRGSEGLLREFSAHAAAGISASAGADKDVCSEIINTVINNTKQS